MIFGDDEKMACPVVLLCALGGWWDCVVISSSKCLWMKTGSSISVPVFYKEGVNMARN